MSRGECHDLGMDRQIPRRDFLNGVAIAVGGTWGGGLGASKRAGRDEACLATTPIVSQTATGEDYPPALTKC